MRHTAAVVLLLTALPATAAELQTVSVDKVDESFIMHSQVLFEADLETLYAVFSDWDLSTQFSSVVVESRNTEADEEGRPGYYVRNRACVAFFCRSFERNGYVELQPLSAISAVADPARSDFHISKESWQFVEQEDGVLVTYDLELDPKFWIPPLIGPYLIKRKLERDGVEALHRIENIALERMQAGG